MDVREAEVRNHANLIWGIAELLRGDYRQSEYGGVILPLVVMRRLDQVLMPTKAAVLARGLELEAAGIENVELPLLRTAGQSFFNRSQLALATDDEVRDVAGVKAVTADTANVATFLRSYVDGYSSLAREVFEKFELDRKIERLEKNGLLYRVVSRICEVDLHPDRVSNLEMGYTFEELIRRFSEQSNETAGHHFTPREVVTLMVNLLLDGDADALTQPGVIRTVFDCACGTGGMLTEADAQIRRLNEQAVVHLYGQELNEESYAICLADMLVKGQDASHVVHGNSLSQDGHRHESFHYGIANPPFGVDWTKVEDEVRDEHRDLGDRGRFGPGLPRKSDGQLLFLLHLISKMRAPRDGGGRVAIVLNGSPLFTGAAGSGESEIRRHIIEHDMLEAIVALPEQLFYNTGIATYVWLVTNRKSEQRRGKVQLIDATKQFVKMRKSLGDKRREISAEQIADVTRLHGAFDDTDKRVRILANEDLGYRTITVEQPLRARWQIGPGTWDGVEGEKAMGRLASESDPPVVVDVLTTMEPATFATEADATAAIKQRLLTTLPKVPAPLLKALVARTLVRDPDAEPVVDKKGQTVADPDLRDTENVPLTEDVEEYLDREVYPHVSGAWCADPDGRVGYEIPITRVFYEYTPPRPSAEIKAELRELEGEIRRLLDEVLV
ncbi:MAG: type I restriction-modification system subunit M [Nocardioidaceae bacterium]